ncbi:nuclear division protein [Scheffersomyces stipitis CBS 6054]|uniref:Nuclear division protein n=1 Tax=Scheffersomyces stipitis (strain ATCC 58785 / CBS 6054 / NBRC 10063 / NRRL Y-11545) TaxID=322104 RepID=A3LWB2_PICST|nr:nuclear division protein [Scheffersomyces stipitis CBS 6054]ABN67252.2 nuclear division protein [Scheffersomyces stipitis CBS 6054]
MSGSRASSSATPTGQRPTAKRSPSILVTDSRTHTIKGTRAPFAGHNYKKQQQQQQQQNKYTDISVDKLLSNSSDIPSGQSRLPPLISSTNRRASSPLGSQRSPSPPVASLRANGLRRNIRSIPKLSSSLPSRTSKTSQKLVLIPESQRYHTNSPPNLPPNSTSTSSQASAGAVVDVELQAQIERSRAEMMSKDARAQEFSRMTAYFICEQFNLAGVSKFLRENHEVKPRMYDEALYVPYALPLLPGADGFRVKSNNSAKLLPNKRYMEKMINKSEQTDHLYEYYSGVETPEDANNYSMDPELENFDSSSPFDPSEPQFFAPPLETSGISEDGVNSISSNGETTNTVDTSESKETSPSSDSKRSHSIHSSLHSQAEVSKHHAEMFVFAYGIVVFWNFSEIHEKNILADLAFADEPQPLLIHPIDEQDIETEEFHFEYDSQIHRPRIYNDMITLRSGDHLIKLTMSHAIAQSTKLCLFESRMVNILQSISKMPKKLALTGTLGLKRTQLLKKSGKLFKLRVDVNLSSSILDTPDFFWSIEPALHPLYNAVREYLEIDQRVQVLNDRCKVFLEFVDIVSDSMNEKNTNRITWMIIVIIFLSLTVSVFEFFLEVI